MTVSNVIVPFTVTSAAITDINTTETVDAWNSGSTYGLGDLRRLDSTGRIYRSLQSGNTNKDPATEPDWWYNAKPTQRMAMFDNANRTQAEAEDELTSTYATTGYVDSVALFNLQGSAAQVIAKKDGLEVYNQTRSLLDNSVVTSWATYFFEPLIRRRKTIFTGIPKIANLDITTSIVGGGTVKCGSNLPGRTRFIGKALMDSNMRLTDYSLAGFDEDGNYDPTLRPSSQGGTFKMIVPLTQLEALTNLMDDLRTLPLVWDMVPGDPLGLLFAKYNSFKPVWSYPEESLFELDLEGLT